MKRNLYIGGAFLALLLALGTSSILLQKRAVVHAACGNQAPRFEVDPIWPKPLPNQWLLGQTIGASVDSTVDYKGYVWIGGNGCGTPPGGGGTASDYYHDNMILKFTQDGKFLMQIEVQAPLGRDDVNLGRYNPNDAPAQQFRNPVHCAELSHDGLLYVCDRPNDRIQIFKPDGTLVKEKILYKNTLGDGSVWDIAFSKDPDQKYIFLADGANEKFRIIDRESLEVLTNFGDGGRQPKARPGRNVA
jgi:hypothetical protein